MSWENVSLKDVSPNQGFDVVEAGEYTFQILPGAKIDQRGGLSMQLSIASDGPNKGRRIFISYPDPTQDKMAWSTGALKRLEQSVGIDQEEGEGLVAWANRLGESFASFAAPLTVRTYKNDAGDEVSKNDVKLFKVKPAA